jgi:TldD protein
MQEAENVCKSNQTSIENQTGENIRMISELQMQSVLGECLKTGGDFAELYFEDSVENNLYMVNGTMDRTEAVRICGCGIYVLKGTKSAYAYTNDLSYQGLLQTAGQAAALLSQTGNRTIEVGGFTHREYPSPNKGRILSSTIPAGEKLPVLEEASRYAYEVCPDLKRLNVTNLGKEQHVTVVNTEGLYAEDTRMYNRIRLNYVMGRGREHKSGFLEYNRVEGWEAFEDLDPMRREIGDSLRGKAASFDGKTVKSCKVPVIMEAGVCGTVWHEACGHPLESVAIAGHASEFEGLLGQKVATEKVTLIDDGTIPGLYGSLGMDDEGHPTQKNILIEKGVLKGYLCDRLGARKLGMAPTGSGRRQGYMYAPVARMNNTYLEVGEDREEDLLSSIDDGLYIKAFGGGSGGREFSLAVEEGYWIHNGRIVYPVKGLTLTGKGLDLLQKIDGVGGIQGYDGGSFCGADSGLCPVTAFQPRIRIREMNVGGEEA